MTKEESQEGKGGGETTYLALRRMDLAARVPILFTT